MVLGSNAPSKSNKLNKNAATSISYCKGLYAHISTFDYPCGKAALQLTSTFAV